MNTAAFLLASVGVTLGGTGLLVWSSWRAMRRAERSVER